MRKFVVLVFVLALLVGGFSVVDVVVRHRVETMIGDRIESRSPGSHAVVSISSFPFLGFLAASGRVPALRVDVTGATDGTLHFQRIHLVLDDLKMSRAKLEHGQVEALSIRLGTVVAEISQSALDAFAHLPVTLGQGRAGVDGITTAVHVTIADKAITVVLGHDLPDIRVPIPELDVLPCVGAAQVLPGVLRLSCTFRTLPGFLAGTTFS